MEVPIELLPLPSTDVDRSKAFGDDEVGFRPDHDIGPPVRGVRLVAEDLETARGKLLGTSINLPATAGNLSGDPAVFRALPDPRRHRAPELHPGRAP